MKQLLTNSVIARRAPRARPRLAAACQVWLLIAVGTMGSFSLPATVAQGEETPTPADDAKTFERDVVPIFVQHCLKCHGGEALKAGLDLRTISLVRRGSTNGSILPTAENALGKLLAKVTAKEMPPPGELPLTEQKIATIGAWVKGGMASTDDPKTLESEGFSPSPEDRQFWSFRVLARPTVPTPTSGLAESPIDAFLLHKLEAAGLTFSSEADRRALIRRVSFDLLGLPPTPEEVEAFCGDTDPAAYEKLLDRLFANPHFGERWGRRWLDVAGYVDTVGADNDAAIILPAEGKWKYRDYVVDSFNKDKPINRFIMEQLAGDELVDWKSAKTYTPDVLEPLLATGFLRNVADRTSEFELNTADIRYPVLYDSVELIGTALLGVTMQCARCHSHKFEPISTEEYYQLMSALTPAYNVHHWLQPQKRIPDPPPVGYRTIPDLTLAEKEALDAQNNALQKEIDQLNMQANLARQPARERLFQEKIKGIPEALRADLEAAVKKPEGERDAVQKYLVMKLGPLVDVKPEEIQPKLTPEESAKVQEFERQAADLKTRLKAHGYLQVMYDVAPPPHTFVHRRGDFLMPGMEVAFKFPAVLSKSDAPVVPTPPRPETSGRRLALAKWLTDPTEPSGSLVARVMVNRVWAHLFGQGIAKTTGNLGKSGTPPTHPELLEYLAVDFVEHDWQFKRLIRQIMLSRAYRQASSRAGGSATLPVPVAATGTSSGPAGTAADSHAAPSTDAANELLWRMRLRRLESETVRDSIMAVSGVLQGELGGPPIMVDPKPNGAVVIKEDALPNPQAKFRRTMYVLNRRAYHLTLLDVFDQPVIDVNCTKRDSSSVVTQTLAMLNSDFLAEQAGFFAQRIEREATAGDLSAQVSRAFQLALSRPPSPEELSASFKLLDQHKARFSQNLSPAEAEHQAKARLCLMLLNCSEFLYLE